MKIKVLSIAGIILLLAAAAGAYFLLSDGGPRGPEQPIAFPHPVHVQEGGMECAYCHYSTDRAAGAGMPSLQLCVGCHVPGSGSIAPEEAQLGFPQGSEEAERMVEYWRQQQAIEWREVNYVPRHAQFPHNVHTNVGLECSTCHGPVEEMDRVYQWASLRMGWCMSCHRGEMELSPQEQQTVEERSSYVRTIRAAADDGIDVRAEQRNYPNQIASVDCTVCHY